MVSTARAVLLSLVACSLACGDGDLHGSTKLQALSTDTATFAVVSAANGLALDVANADSGNGALATQDAFGATPTQQWTLSPSDGGTYVATNAHSGKVLDVTGVSAQAGAVIHQWDYVGGSNQKWQLELQSDGMYVWKSQHSGLCLDVSGASHAPGASIIQWTCSGAINQRWRVQQVSGGAASFPPQGAVTAPPVTTPPVIGPPATAPQPSPTPTKKKGVGTWWDSRNTLGLQNLAASWAYDWRSSPAAGNITPSASLEYVPMIWTANNVTSSDLASAKSSGSALLAFNEPDQNNPQDGQPPMSVGTALSLWPQLSATGLRMGSPAVAHNGDQAGGWLDSFMQGAKAQGLRVDFIALHWYASTFDVNTAVSELQAYLQAVYSRYGLPIWLTEFAMIDFTSGGGAYPPVDTQAAFAAAAVHMLEAQPFVERYAWFALPSYRSGNNTSLANSDGSLTQVGQAYHDAH